MSSVIGSSEEKFTASIVPKRRMSLKDAVKMVQDLVPIATKFKIKSEIEEELPVTSDETFEIPFTIKKSKEENIDVKHNIKLKYDKPKPAVDVEVTTTFRRKASRAPIPFKTVDESTSEKIVIYETVPVSSNVVQILEVTNIETHTVCDTQIVEHTKPTGTLY